MLEHGGRLARAALRYDIPRMAWLDLSTGISPFAWPVPPIPPAAWHRLPEDDDALLAAAQAYYGTPHLLPVAGSQAAIVALPRLRPRSRVAVLAPSYAEHAHAWRQGGHDVVGMPLAALREQASTFDVVVLARPNNPTGELIGRDDVFALQRELGRSRGTGGEGSAMPWLVVDEAFIDTRPDDSVTPAAGDGLIVMRSVGKFFGLAGARAGFVAAAPSVLGPLAEALGPWTIAGPTRHVVTRALGDHVWQASARECLRRGAARLGALLAKHGLAPSGGSDFFQYVACNDAAALADALARRAVLVRRFDEPRALRFGVPGDEEAFARLDVALWEALA